MFTGLTKLRGQAMGVQHETLEVVEHPPSPAVRVVGETSSSPALSTGLGQALFLPLRHHRDGHSHVCRLKGYEVLSEVSESGRALFHANDDSVDDDAIKRRLISLGSLLVRDGKHLWMDQEKHAGGTISVLSNRVTIRASVEAGC
jgi:hypothetical protein